MLTVAHLPIGREKVRLLRMEAKTRRIPEKVRRLMRKEYKRQLRESFCSLFEEQLSFMGEACYGITLRRKMEMFPKEATQCLKHWSVKNGVEFAYWRSPWDSLTMMMANEAEKKYGDS